MFLKNSIEALIVFAPLCLAQSTPNITAVKNVASYATGPVSPGEMIFISGTAMGPASLATLQLDQSGKLTTALAGVSVHFFSTSPNIAENAPLVYVSANQIAAMVPYGLAGAQTAFVDVIYQNVASNEFQLSVAPTAPGLFSANASGTGQAAMTNSDGSLNSSANPANPGTYVTFYVTGAGQTNPAGSDGTLASGAAKLVLPLYVTMAGQQAQLLYAGAAPQEVDGFTQVNAAIPSNLPYGGNVPLLVQVGGVSSQTGITVAVSGPAAKRTVVLVHGIGQGSSDMNTLYQDLSDPAYGIDTTRFTIDHSFDWSPCANTGASCPSYCSIEEGATELASHIASLPTGHIILVGYSMGGLLARDLLLNNRDEVLNSHPVDALVTLGTPNIGYPGEKLDDLWMCPALVTEMTSDYRSQQATNTVVESSYLYQLNNAWTTKVLPISTLHWLAVAGTFCSNPIRDSLFNTGCRDAYPYSDAAVCADSADFNLSGANVPTIRWNSPKYAHTNTTLLNFLAPTGCEDVQNYTPLFAPPTNSDLIQTIRTFINGQ